MNNTKTEILNREELRSQISDNSIKHLWLASQIGVSEKTLSRWVNGDVTRIRNNNLNKLAGALGCERAQLVAKSEIDLYPSPKNRSVLANELNNDSLLNELLVSSKIKLAISLIKSTFHSTLPNAIMSNFYTKLGYASLIQRKQKAAKKYFDKGLSKAKSVNSNQLIFSAHLGLAITLFFDCEYKKCLGYLARCESNLEFAGQEKAHFYNTFSLYYLYCGDFDSCIEKADNCIYECSPSKQSTEKDLFLSSALQLRAACFLFKGDIKQAKSSSIESLTISEKSGYKRSVAVSKAYLAAAYAVEKQFQSATILIEESLQLVGPNDISLPSLLCIAIYVARAKGENQTVIKLFENLSALDNTGSTPIAFAAYQMYLGDKQQGDLEAANLRLSQVKSSLAALELNLWQDWLDLSTAQASSAKSTL